MDMETQIDTEEPRSELIIRSRIAKRAMELSPEKALKLFVTERLYAVSILCDLVLEHLLAHPNETFKQAVEHVFDTEIERLERLEG